MLHEQHAAVLWFGSALLMIDTAKEFVDLRSSERPEDYLRAANETAPLEVWTEVLSNYPEMKVWVARNKAVPIEVLEQLALDPDWRVRHAVAMKNKLAEALMLSLAKDANSAVRERIAHNKNASDHVLQRLTQDTEFSIAIIARQKLALRRA